MTVAGQTYLVRPDDHRLIDVLKQAKAQSRSAVLHVNYVSVPYKCVGAAIITLQEVCFMDIGFDTEPPPKR